MSAGSAKADTRYDNMPDLEFVVLESREVPAWEPHSFQPEISEYYRQRTREGILRGEPQTTRREDPWEVPF